MGKKDAYWFKHDSTSGRGLRLMKIQHIYDHWGKGVYWDVVEVLREQSGYRYENSEIALQLLAGMIGVKDTVKFHNFFKDCVRFSLFKIKGSFFYSEALQKNMKNWETKKTNGSKGGRPKKPLVKNRNESETITETKAKQKDNIREEKNREEKIISKGFGIETFFNDLPNSKYLEDISRDLKITKAILVTKIPEFKKSASVDYANFQDFCNHFKRWVNKGGSSNTSEPKRNQL
jgi:hypothetical protein